MDQKLDVLRVRGAREHNLKNIDVDIPKNKVVVLTGLSGSGKSSLAFDTIYAEGQRRYMESLSSYARQFLELQDKPDVDEIQGLCPTIAIDQKSSSHNPRSTVGTVTETYDLLRVLFARAGQSHCPCCKERVQEQTLDQIAVSVANLLKAKESLLLLAPVIQQQKGEHRHVFLAALSAGFSQARFDGLLMDVEDALLVRKDKKKTHDIEILIARMEPDLTYQPEHLKALVRKALDYGNGFLLVVNDDTGEDTLFSQSYRCATCQIFLPKPEPRLFSFNAPLGACTDCTGLGMKLVLEPELVMPNKRLTLAEGAVRPWSRITGHQNGFLSLVEAVGKRHKFSIHTPVERLSLKAMNILLYGTGEETYTHAGTAVTFSGILSQLEQKYRETDSEYVRHELEGYMRKMSCPACAGKRLKPEVLAIKVLGKNIADLVCMPVEDAFIFFQELLSSSKGKISWKEGLRKEEVLVVERVAKEMLARLRHLMDVGLGYLTLDRAAMTLSGGESQRVRLATQLGSGLSGVMYILDEPSIGLHPRDNDCFIETIRRLQDLGNSVLVVEHDAAMMRAADYIFDIGPGAGIYGGEIVAQGTPAQIMKQKDSLTGAYLSGRKCIPTPTRYRKGSSQKITIEGASEFNLKQVTVDIPLGTLTCVTGVSGSGKSTLILDILGKTLARHFYRAKVYPGAHQAIKGIEHIDKVVAVDQSPIGRTPRSNPATYTGVFTAIREVFAQTQEAKLHNYQAGMFSFNVKNGGRCEVCGGDGVRCIEMQFLPDVYVECPECHGSRYRQEIVDIHYREKSIADVLAMTIEEAQRFFSDQPAIFEKLHVLYEVGLGYLRLGQSATTLSGGEAQRVKLATELSRRATGRTLYILDEPTTGLHFEDIKRLLAVLNRLVDKGNTVVVIEHHLDVIKGSDWVIDLGPEGGIKGGEIVAQGTPKEIIKEKKSLTGQYLQQALER
jgi:excinuclease ABC subunit A